MSRRPAARDSVAAAEETEAVEAINNAVAAEQRSQKEWARNRALTDNVKLRDENARLLLEIAEARQRRTEATVRADRDTARADSLRQALATQAAAHAAEIERLQAAQQLALTDLRAEHRRELVAVNTAHTNKVRDMMREHAERMEQVMSGRRPTTTPTTDSPAPLPAPKQMINAHALKQRKTEIEAMPAVGDPDSYEVRVYNTLIPYLQFTMKALALGFTSSHIAAALQVPLSQVDRYVLQLCRRFKEDSQVGLMNLGQILFIKEEER
jgi:hypothetical protein